MHKFIQQEQYKRRLFFTVVKCAMVHLERNETNINVTPVECRTRWRMSDCDNKWTTGIGHVKQLILDRKKSIKIPTYYIPGTVCMSTTINTVKTKAACI